ncbi:hypothetical protein BpHYR1_010705 [Brachionus plicatilis]|uniref:Uncharacterized protein n=1 Tax=Brachionus plicatilis TaxID=10195 RepID=A0A3M7SL35_BRAPC|nr:hypothetical protein BpHYR1_010705 [Brachionus plicatilis]
MNTKNIDDLKHFLLIRLANLFLLAKSKLKEMVSVLSYSSFRILHKIFFKLIVHQQFLSMNALRVMLKTKISVFEGRSIFGTFAYLKSKIKF